jgi:hypothetical protein
MTQYQVPLLTLWAKPGKGRDDYQTSIRLTPATRFSLIESRRNTLAATRHSLVSVALLAARSNTIIPLPEACTSIREQDICRYPRAILRGV